MAKEVTDEEAEVYMNEHYGLKVGTFTIGMTVFPWFFSFEPYFTETTINLHGPVYRVRWTEQEKSCCLYSRPGKYCVRIKDSKLSVIRTFDGHYGHYDDGELIVKRRRILMDQLDLPKIKEMPL